MIQRIQTLYLLGAVLLASMFSFFNEYAVTAWESLGLASVGASLLALLASLLSFLAIFLFKNRKGQLMLIGLNIFLLLAGIVFYSLTEGLDEFYKDWTFYLLLVAIVMLVLARKGVKADEALIRSANRLR